MRDIVDRGTPDDEQRSYRGKSLLPFGLQRHRAVASSRLLPDVPHRLRRRFSPRPSGARNKPHGTSNTGC